jgi:hypothetical protein
MCTEKQKLHYGVRFVLSNCLLQCIISSYIIRHEASCLYMIYGTGTYMNEALNVCVTLISCHVSRRTVPVRKTGRTTGLQYVTQFITLHVVYLKKDSHGAASLLYFEQQGERNCIHAC